MTTTDAPQTNQITPARRPRARIARVWTAATAAAVLLVTAAQLIAQEFADPLIISGAGEVTLGNVIGFTVLGAAIGAALAAGIGRFTSRPRATFLTATLTALAGYAVVPFTAAESSSTALWLNLFHLIVAVPVIGMFARWLPGVRTSVET